MRRSPVALAAALTCAAVVAGGCAPALSSNPADGPPSSPPLRSSPPTSHGSSSPGGTGGSSTSVTPQGAAKVTMVMSGDVLLHNTLWWNAERDAARTGRGHLDFRPALADMRPVIRGADLAICHMETPLAPRGGPYSSYPVFSVPPQIVPALKWEGYDACTTMSNHSLDDGYAGIVRTLHDFDEAGIGHFGTVTSKAASRQPYLVTVKGVRIALIGATYGTNGIPLPSEAPWSVPLIKPAEILRKARIARRDGADIVVVALHWGDEYVHQPSADQLRVARRITRSPAVDFVYGHHVHVVQPYDKVNGTWVVYGLGNAIAEQDPAVEGVYDGNTCRVTFTRQPDGSYRVSRLQYIPTMITHYDFADPAAHPMRWLDIRRALHQPQYAYLRSDLLATQARVRSDVDLLGALQHGVTEGG